MGMVAPQQRIASAYFVIFGHYGDVSRYAQERGVCRQWVYREAQSGAKAPQERSRRTSIYGSGYSELTQRQADMEKRLAVAVVLDQEKQEEFASVGQAMG